MTRILFDYSKLFNRMKDYRYSQTQLASDTNIERVTLNAKLIHRSSFKQEEILAIANALDITTGEIGDYFFTPEVRITGQK